MKKNKNNLFKRFFNYCKKIHIFEFAFYLILLTFLGCYCKIGLVMMYAIEVTLGMAFMNIVYIESIYYRKLKDIGITEEDILNVKFDKEKKE